MATAAIICMMFVAAAAMQLSREQGRKGFSGESDSHKSTLFSSVMSDFFFLFAIKMSNRLFDLCSVTVQFSSLLTFISLARCCLFFFKSNYSNRLKFIY